MSIQKFPLEKIQKVRQYIKSVLTLAEPEPQPISRFPDDDEVPEPESLDELSGIFNLGGVAAVELSPENGHNRWTISTVNPAAALSKLPGLQLKPEFRLVCYLYRSKESGIGVVWAVPEALSTTACLERVIIPNSTMAQFPKPEGALPNFMAAITGDRSSASFLIASILRRELQEFGASGQRCKWSHHQLIDAIPTKLQWQWQGEPPKDLAPKVKVQPGGEAAIEFFSCRTIAPFTIFRHVEQYPAHEYCSNCIDKGIAVGQR